MTNKEEKLDLIAVLGSDPETGGERAVRINENGVSAGVMNPLVHGKPIPQGGEIIATRPLNKEGTLYVARTEITTRNGPAKVNSAAFQTGWDNIWGQGEDASTKEMLN